MFPSIPQIWSQGPTNYPSSALHFPCFSTPPTQCWTQQRYAMHAMQMMSFTSRPLRWHRSHRIVCVHFSFCASDELFHFCLVCSICIQKWAFVNTRPAQKGVLPHLHLPAAADKYWRWSTFPPPINKEDQGALLYCFAQILAAIRIDLILNLHCLAPRKILLNLKIALILSKMLSPFCHWWFEWWHECYCWWGGE